MTRFSMFTDEELDAMESAFCNERLKSLVYEIRRERRCRESRISAHDLVQEILKNNGVVDL